jgi:PKD repeat protein
MKTRSTFTEAGWNFTNVWFMIENITYPFLRWQDTETPQANAGIDQTVDEGILVRFDASRSSDDFGIFNYTWTFIDGAPVTLHGVGATYRFDDPGVFVVSLNVTDGAGHWGTDTVTITVRDVTPPTADAGPSRIVDEGTLVTFDGRGSSDNIGIVNYTWTFADGAPVTLHGVQPTYWFSTPGVFVVTLNVTDAEGNRGTDTVTVTVKDIQPPVADAGPDLTVDEDTLVTFDGSGSSDNVGVVNHTWTFDHGTDEVLLYGVSPSFTFTIPGIYSIRLNVTDAAGHWHEDAMALTVNDVTPPVADAGPDREVPVGAAVSFDGTPSTDNVGISEYSWTFTYEGIPRTLEGAVVQFTFDRGGKYELVLTVADPSGNLDDDSVIISVVSWGRVTGTVLDEDGRPVEGAAVEMTASDGRTSSTTTAANGSFLMYIHHGAFTWKVAKKGYRTISGSASVEAMGETELDLSDHPLVKVEVKGPSIPLYLLPAIVIILIVAGVVLFLWKGKKGGGPQGE